MPELQIPSSTPSTESPAGDSTLQAPEPQARFWMKGRWVIAFWVLVGISFFAFLGSPPVSRTQEARVLETAREMIDQPATLNGWLIPQLNGASRLRKPPLAYWLSAIAFQIGGVNETAGRLPMAIIGWLTVGVTFAIADRLFDRRKAVFSAGALATSYLFFKHSRLSETDGPATLFVTLAIYCLLRAAADSKARWHHAAALAMGLAFNAKGLPGLFPLIFLIVYSACERRWDVGRRFLFSGAPLTVLLIGGAWYFYAGATHGVRQFMSELREVGTGEDHNHHFYVYGPWLALATVPWCGMVIGGIVGACARWRIDWPLRVLAIWSLALLLPLFFVPNKQLHYLLPLMPPLMMFAGWAIDVACGGAAGRAHPSDLFSIRLLRGTVICLALIGLAGLPIAAQSVFHQIRRIDIVVASCLAIVTLGGVYVHLKKGAVGGTAALFGGLLVGLPVLIGFWFPGAIEEDDRAVAAKIKTVCPTGPYAFYGEVHLPLVYYLRTPIHVIFEPKSLAATLARAPSTAFITRGSDRKPGKPMIRPPAAVGPNAIVRLTKILSGSEVTEVYVARRNTEPRPATGPSLIKSRF